MLKTEKWHINITKNFSETESIHVNTQSANDGHIEMMRDNKSYRCKKNSLWKFILKRYPLLILSTIVISMIFLAIHPLAFLFYSILFVGWFSFSVRLCIVHNMGTHIMIFWMLSLLINFISLGMENNYSVFSYQAHFHMQSLFFGMILLHLWSYLAIFFYKYNGISNILEEIETGVYVSTDWYIWKGCSLCDKNFNPFKNNRKAIV